ncbi:protein of unknown function (plasmid) [Cupriavidus taiwanensis]|uniref:Uncharacterized protein n=1 Tax=Cupriavidus taiwanensis TaxID=164546 RepID=A0A375IME8_9BURK|nr:protein of unknown function [Cupriavidus taiwanensis]
MASYAQLAQIRAETPKCSLRGGPPIDILHTTFLRPLG